VVAHENPAGAILDHGVRGVAPEKALDADAPVLVSGLQPLGRLRCQVLKGRVASE